VLNMYFCYRWIIIGFKREFSVEDIYRFWEVWFSGYEDFHLFVAIGILLRHRDIIISENYGFDDALQYINNLSMNLDLNECIQTGEALLKKVKEFNEEKKRDIFEI